MNILGHSGYLIGDAQYFPAQGEKQSRAIFTMAVRRPFSKVTDLYDYVAWNTAADIIGNGMNEGRYLKGCYVEVSGSTSMNSYTETETGKERKRLQIVIQQCFSMLYEGEGQNYDEGDAGYGNPDGFYDDPNAAYEESYADGQYYQNNQSSAPRNYPRSGNPQSRRSAAQPNIQPRPAQGNRGAAVAQNRQARPAGMNRNGAPVMQGRPAQGARVPVNGPARMPAGSAPRANQGGYTPAARR